MRQFASYFRHRIFARSYEQQELLRDRQIHRPHNLLCAASACKLEIVCACFHAYLLNCRTMMAASTFLRFKKKFAICLPLVSSSKTKKRNRASIKLTSSMCQPTMNCRDRSKCCELNTRLLLDFSCKYFAYAECFFQATLPKLPADLQGKTFSAVLNTTSSAMERLLMETKLRGPCWIDIDNCGE